MKKFIFVFSAIFAAFPSVFAADIPDTSRFEFFREIEITGIITPKVVRVEIPEEILGETILLDETEKPMPHEILRQREKLPMPSVFVTSVSSTFEGDKSALLDENSNTKFAFSPEGDYDKSVIFDFGKVVEISQIFIDLDSSVIPPQKVSVFADFGDGNFQVMISRKTFSSQIEIPKITPARLKINFETPHFLRMSDISFGLENAVKKANAVIFFAEEGKKYRLFFGAHFGAKTAKTDFQPLETDTKTPNFVFGDRKENPIFNGDLDGDGIADETDLCPRDADGTNADTDKNGRGDFCEDPDLDGRASAKDNCPFAFNSDQADADSDDIGDKCDNAESRFSENHPEILWLAMAGIIAILGFVMWRVARKS